MKESLQMSNKRTPKTAYKDETTEEGLSIGINSEIQESDTEIGEQPALMIESLSPAESAPPIESATVGIRADVSSETSSFLDRMVKISGFSKGDIIDLFINQVMQQEPVEIVVAITEEITRRAELNRTAVMDAFGLNV